MSDSPLADPSRVPSLAQQEDLEDEDEVEGDERERSELNSTFFKNSNSLKRSITLPRNPFFSPSRVKKAKNANLDSKIMSGNSAAETFSVRNFFHKIVSHKLIRTRGPSAAASHTQNPPGGSGKKLELTEEKLQLWKERLEEGKVPGVIGIKNHGNTCFINAILQCLNHTDLLAEYFVLDQYKSDLRRKRRLANLTSFSRRNASKGEITEQLATLLKSLWSLQYDPEISVRFKSLIEKHASQYKGCSQHDAQEFLLWLLDQVHEDLNMATKRRYKMSKNNAGERTDEQLATESLANYMRCNNSFVMDVFQAQFRSSLTCPTCERQSNTFDPFLCVSLPIPQKQLMPVYVIVLYMDQCPRQVNLGLMIGIHETVKELRNALSRDTGIESEQILLTEIGALGFGKTLQDLQSVQVIKDLKEPLYCIEMPRQKEASEDDGAFVNLTWINLFKEGPIQKRFGSPYTIQVSRETLYADLQKLLMKEMASILHDDILIANQKVPLFKIRVLNSFLATEEDKSHNLVYLDANTDLPLYEEAVEQAINLNQVDSRSSGPVHVKLVLEWDMPAKSQVINDDTDVIEEHSSVKEVSVAPEKASLISLQECFELYTSAEKLGQGDAWFCPACNCKQEVVKRMGLWSVPDVLLIHLKRFKHGTSSAKLSTMVDFPLEGFDMTPNVSKPNPSRDHGLPENVPPSTNETSGMKVLSALSPWRQPKKYNTIRHHDHIYDLYAVCNHHGNDLQGGHYTSYCRNPTDDKWYSFDDIHTMSISESEVVTNDAYILFYQRQAASSSSASSSSSGSSMQEHWVFRMPDFEYKKKTGVVKKVTGKQDSSRSSTAFRRNGQKYATMPVRKSESNLQDKHEEILEERCNSDLELNSDINNDENTLTATTIMTGSIEPKLKKDCNQFDVDKEDEEEIARPPDKNDVD